MTSLLDVNVLIALAWPHHVHHAAASSWFAESRTAGWATCPATEAGFVRGCCNPAVTRATLSVRDALQMLARLRRTESHRFWPMTRSITEMPTDIVGHIQGYRQVPDAVLLALAREHQGRIATFDTGLANLQPPGRRPSVFLIPA